MEIELLRAELQSIIDSVESLSDTYKERAFKVVLQQLQILTAELQQLSNRSKAESLTHSNNDAVSAISPDKVVESPSENKEDYALSVSEWITTKGIKVNRYHKESEADPVFDELSLFLGENFRSLSLLHELIRRNLSTGRRFSLNLSSRSQKEIADSTAFCSLLNSYAFLSSYYYDRQAKIINASPQKTANVTNFFTGGWFERYIYKKILSFFSQKKLDLTSLLNPSITFSNGNDFELDLLFLVDNQPLWIECKTGDYQNYIAKYSSVRKLLSIAKERAILVILDIPDDLTMNLTSLFDITVANENNFLKKASDAAGLPQYPQEQESIALPVSTGITGSFSAFLVKTYLRPMPEHRQKVINELITEVSSLKQPTTLVEMRSLLAQKTGLSKAIVRDILNAIARGSCLLDDEDQIAQSLRHPFSRLSSHNPSLLESKCMESYVCAALLFDSTYFDNQNNIAEFERLVGCKAPDMATITVLREKLLGSM